MKNKTKKYNTVLYLIIFSAFMLALIITISYKNYFSKVPMVVIKNDIKTLPAFTKIEKEHLSTIYVTKDEINYFKDFYTKESEVLGKYTTVELTGGSLISKNHVVDFNDMTKEQVGLTEGEYRTIAIPIKPEYSLNCDFSAGKFVDLYFINLYRTQEDIDNQDNEAIYIIPVQNLIKIKNKITIDKTTFAVIEIKDVETEKYLSYLYLANTGKGYFAITQPGVKPTDYKGKVLRVRDFITTELNK